MSEAIRSILAQTMPHWRLVVAENGPGGGAVEETVRAVSGDPRIAYIANGADLGPARNYTNLIRTGQAPYVALLHDDDRWEPTFLERRVAFLDAHPECGFIFSGFTIIDARGEPTGRSPLPLPEGVFAPSDFLPLLYRWNIVGVPSVVVRRTAYDAVGAAYNDRVSFTDHEMWLRLAARFPVGVVAAWDAHYRQHPSQDSSILRLHLGERRLEVLDAADELPLPNELRQRARAEVLASCALDAVERAEYRVALRYVVATMRCGRHVLRSAPALQRVGATLGAVALGPPARRLLTKVRVQRFRRQGIERARAMKLRRAR